MQTNKSFHAENLVENDALRPSQPTTDEIIIMSENAYESETTAIPVLFEYTSEFSDRSSFLSSVQELDHWLQFKVRGALVSHIYASLGKSDAGEMTNDALAEIETLITSEIETERERHASATEKLTYELIPAAELRTEPDFTVDNPYTYWKKDVDNLEERLDMHSQMTAYIDTFTASGQDVLRTVTEQYIARTLNDARSEVIAILHEQKNVLEGKLHQLTGERDEAREQVELRDLELLDQELDIHQLTEEARRLAE